MSDSAYSRPRLYLSHVADYDKLIALEFGRVDDGQLEEQWRSVGDERFWWYSDEPGGQVRGFAIRGLEGFDANADFLDEIWAGPTFDAPLVGLTDVCAGEIVVAAIAYFDGRPSINRLYFDSAVGVDGREALVQWRACLESGDSMAHFALGYTHYELGHFPEAYRHLRHYAEIAPAQPWIWVWYAKAATAIGETEEAFDAYERAIALTAAGHDETDAPELLAALEASTPRQESPAGDDSSSKEAR